MDRIDWEALRTEGMPAFVAALSVLERNQAELAAVRAAVPVAQRLETVWFRRYAELLGVLIEAGLPAEVEGPEGIGAWLRGQLGRRTGNGTGRRCACMGGTGGAGGEEVG